MPTPPSDADADAESETESETESPPNHATTMKTNTTSSPVSDRVAQPTIATPTTVSRYYSEPEKLTYDEAEVLVERYFRQDVARSVTRVKHVLTEFGYPYSNHNHQRVMVALRNRCELHSPERSGPMRFKIPERYRSGGDAQ